MSERDKIHAAVGTLVIEATWLEFVAARLVAQTGRTDNEMALLKDRKTLFQEARATAATLPDPELVSRTTEWLDRAQQLLNQRDEVVHSIVIHEHEPAWKAYHPKSGRVLEKPPKAIADLARRVEEHAADGIISSIFEWSGSSKAIDEGAG